MPPKQKPPMGVGFFRQLGFDIDWTPGATEGLLSCLFCEREAHFYVNVETGKWDCKTCDESGNLYSFINKFHEVLTEQTEREQYLALRKIRQIPPQTAKRWGLVYNPLPVDDCWLIPYRNREGNIVSVQLYYPGKSKNNKQFLTGLSGHCLLGLETLSDDPTKPVYIAEGPLDALTIDTALRKEKVRDRYDVLASPSAPTWKDAWCETLRGRKIHLCYDHDKAGWDGQCAVVKKFQDQGIPAEITCLKWEDADPEGYDVSDFWNEYDFRFTTFIKEFSESVNLKRKTKLTFIHGNTITPKPLEWLWTRKIELGGMVSLTGDQGTQKSTIAKDLAARITSGEPFPGEDQADPPANVLYFTSEDPPERVVETIDFMGGDLSKLAVQNVINTKGQQVSLLEEMETLRDYIRVNNVRMIVLDAFNSFLGSDEMLTDIKTRGIVGPIHVLAQETKCVILGIRHWNRSGNNHNSRQRELGPACFSDLARSNLYTTKHFAKDGTEKFALHFQKVSNAPTPSSIGIWVVPKSDRDDEQHIRKPKYWIMSPKQQQTFHEELESYFNNKHQNPESNTAKNVAEKGSKLPPTCRGGSNHEGNEKVAKKGSKLPPKRRGENANRQRSGST